jgi:uncharacterized membrane protein
MDNIWTFVSIMLFYIVLSYLIVPIAFYYGFGKSLSKAGDGFVVGSVLSILLWYFVGSKMVKK